MHHVQSLSLSVMASRFSYSLLTAALLLTSASSLPIHSQPQLSDAQLTKQFRDRFLKGCLRGKTSGVANQRRYCDCMANSYQSRYNGRTLTAISEIAASFGDKGAALVNLMVAPEAKSCIAQS